MAELRPLRAEDADAVAQLFVAAFGDSRRMDGDEIRSWLRNEALPPENLCVLVDGATIVGYGDVWIDGGTVDFDVAAPGRWDTLYAWAERRGRDAGAQRIWSSFVEGHELEALVAARGYRAIRASYTMEIELEAEPPAAVAELDGIEIRPYVHPDDESRAYEAQEESFADHWGHNPQSIETWREFSVKQSNFDPSLWFLAWDSDEVAGLTLNFAERSGDPGYGWVGVVGVRRPWRRRGIGEALLRHSFRALHDRGQRRVRLSVDAESLTGATRLYERVGMRVIRRMNTWQLEL